MGCEKRFSEVHALKDDVKAALGESMSTAPSAATGTRSVEVGAEHRREAAGKPRQPPSLSRAAMRAWLLDGLDERARGSLGPLNEQIFSFLGTTRDAAFELLPRSCRRPSRPRRPRRRPRRPHAPHAAAGEDDEALLRRRRRTAVREDALHRVRPRSTRSTRCSTSRRSRPSTRATVAAMKRATATPRRRRRRMRSRACSSACSIARGHERGALRALMQQVAVVTIFLNLLVAPRLRGALRRGRAAVAARVRRRRRLAAAQDRDAAAAQPHDRRVRPDRRRRARGSPTLACRPRGRVLHGLLVAP